MNFITLRHRDQVDVIGHQTEPKKPKAVARGVFLQYGQVELTVAVVEEDGLPVVAPLRDVMRHPDCHGARRSRTSQSRVARRRESVNKEFRERVDCPRYSFRRSVSARWLESTWKCQLRFSPAAGSGSPALGPLP